MKVFALTLVAAISLSGLMVRANEIRSITDIQEAFVIEPIVEGSRLSCPRGTKPVGKFCWDYARGCLIRCGHVCSPDEVPVPTPEPEPQSDRQ